jgi:hypothetical protein
MTFVTMYSDAMADLLITTVDLKALVIIINIKKVSGLDFI